MSGLFQIFAVIAGVLLLAVGAVGILRGFDVVKGIPEAVAGFSLKKIAKILLLAFVAIEILLLIFLIVLCVANTSEQSGYQYGVKFSAGMFVSLAFAIIGAALPFVIKEG